MVHLKFLKCNERVVSDVGLLLIFIDFHYFSILLTISFLCINVEKCERHLFRLSGIKLDV